MIAHAAPVILLIPTHAAILRSISELASLRAALSRHRRLRWCASRSSGGHFHFGAPRQRAGGTPVVVTFDPHPAKVLRPQDAPHLLTATAAQDCAHPRSWSGTSARSPFRPAVRRDSAGRICPATGHAFASHSARFASDTNGLSVKGARANLLCSNSSASSYDFAVVGVQAVTVNGEVVSSTAIRRAVAERRFGQGDADARPGIHDSRHGESGRTARPQTWISDREPERAQRTISTKRSLRRPRHDWRAPCIAASRTLATARP